MGKEAKVQAKFSWVSHYGMKNVVILIEMPPYTSCNHNKDLQIASYLFLMTITIKNYGWKTSPSQNIIKQLLRIYCCPSIRSVWLSWESMRWKQDGLHLKQRPIPPYFYTLINVSLELSDRFISISGLIPSVHLWLWEKRGWGWVVVKPTTDKGSDGNAIL